jgi:import inner membrane translocase subunit TIM21
MMNRVTASGLRLRPSALHSNSNTTALPLSLQLTIVPHYNQHHHHRHHQQHRRYATQDQQTSTPESRRRSVTPFNDDGHVPWTQLSASEKTGRAAQQTFNFGMVIVGLALTGGVGYVLYSEVFSSDSKTTYFNKAVDRIRKDPRCLELLGDGKHITAYGEETSNKWRRARPIA